MVDSKLPSIADAIDQGAISPRQWITFGLCALVVLVDGWATQAIGIVAPLLRSDLGLSQSQVGVAFSISHVGAILGAVIFGSLADRFGRKPLLLVAMAIITAFTLVTALSRGYTDLLVVRFVAGIGLGGAIPCSLALASEFAPKRLRGSIVTMIFAAFPLGGAVGALVNAWLVRSGDWRLVFYAGGVLTLLSGLAIALFISESPQFLASRGLTARVEALLQRFGLSADPRLASSEPVASKKTMSLRALFQHGAAWTTLLLLAVYFFSFATTMALGAWLPTLLQQSGLALSTGGVALAFFNIGAAIGAGVSGRLVDRFGPSFGLAPALVMSSVCIVALSTVSANPVAVCLLAVVAGAFLCIGAAGIKAVTVLFYPPFIRSTGLGLGVGASRFGQVVSPMLIGVMLAAELRGVAIYATIAVAPLVAAAAAAGLGLAIRRHRDRNPISNRA